MSATNIPPMSDGELSKNVFVSAVALKKMFESNPHLIDTCSAVMIISHKEKGVVVTPIMPGKKLDKEIYSEGHRFGQDQPTVLACIGVPQRNEDGLYLALSGMTKDGRIVETTMSSLNALPLKFDEPLVEERGQSKDLRHTVLGELLTLFFVGQAHGLGTDCISSAVGGFDELISAVQNRFMPRPGMVLFMN